MNDLAHDHCCLSFNYSTREFNVLFLKNKVFNLRLKTIIIFKLKKCLF